MPLYVRIGGSGNSRDRSIIVRSRFGFVSCDDTWKLSKLSCPSASASAESESFFLLPTPTETKRDYNNSYTVTVLAPSLETCNSNPIFAGTTQPTLILRRLLAFWEFGIRLVT